MEDAQHWIEKLGLSAHPEGGYFRETYRAAENVDASALPVRFGGTRAFSTAIYFLLESSACSRLHRLKADELWFFHTGSPLTIHVIDADGTFAQHRLGDDLAAGQSLQAIIPAGCWFGATVDRPDAYTLVSCTAAPGFEFSDFEPGERDALLEQYPEHAVAIRRLTKA